MKKNYKNVFIIIILFAFLILFIINWSYGLDDNFNSSTDNNIDWTNDENLNLKKIDVEWFKSFNVQEYGTQGMTLTDKYIVFTKYLSNDDNTIIVISDINTGEILNTNNNYNFRHANDLTWDSTRDELYILTSSNKIAKFKIEMINSKPEMTNLTYIDCQKQYTGIAYNKDLDCFIAYCGFEKEMYILNHDFQVIKHFPISTNLTSQGIGYSNGIIYFCCYENGKPSNHQEIYNQKERNSNLIYKYDLDGNLIETLYIPNTLISGELETCDFLENGRIFLSYVFYLGPDNYQIGFYKTKSGWLELDNKWYYFNLEGEMQTGWITDNNNKYYLSPSKNSKFELGEAYTGLNTIDNKIYYFRENGSLVIGWRIIDNKWYYFTEDGAITDFYLINNKWYYFNLEGEMQTGWITKNNNKYYMSNEETEKYRLGEMYTGINEINNKTYYFSEESGTLGKLLVESCKLINNKQYCFNETGEEIDIDIEKNTNYKVKSNYLLGINLNTDISSIYKINDFTIKVKDKNNNDKASGKIVTGDKIEVYLYNTKIHEYISVIKGDITGTGTSNITDVAKLYQYLRNKTPMEDWFKEAGNVVSVDNEIKINDVAKLYQFIKGKIDNLEVKSDE